MQIIKMKFGEHNFATLRCPEEGAYFCPICGSLYYGSPGYWPYGYNPESGRSVGSWQECPNCGIVYGHTDMVLMDAGPGSTEAAWKEIRLEWLNRTGWQDQDLRKLKENLEIDVEALKKEAGR